MRLLLDTHMVLWTVVEPERLPVAASDLVEDWRSTLFFSTVSIWEIAIKSELEREDFRWDAEAIREGLLEHGFKELPLLGRHALMTRHLPKLHHDPFDRILIAQAAAEKMHLLTIDETISLYPGDIIFAKSK